MIKRTLYFGNPAYLSLKDNQLVAERRIGSTEDEAAEEGKPVVMRVPIEDIGTILLDHPMITITQPVLREMISHNVAVVSCDESHMPNGMFLPLAGSGVQPERFRSQALVASGLLPTQGIHHSNKYNAYPLADDIMEPYRPYVDAIVFEIVKNGEDYEVLTKSIKQQLLSLAAVDVIMNGKRRPLHIAMQRTTSSLAFCFLGERRRILYPELGGHTEEADTQNTIAPNSP
jgi:CRISPR/Cas system-associated endonuclease Cas1